MPKRNNNKYLFYLILLSTFLTLFKFTESTLSLTYGDFAALIIIVIFLNGFLKGRYKYQRFSKYWTYYLIVLFISGLLNLTFFEGRFMNIFKTNLVSLIYFIIIYTLVVRKELLLSDLFKGFSFLGVLFLVKTWPEIQKAWASSDINFTNVNIFDSSLNLNTWGFILVLFLIITMYFWMSKIYTRLSLVFSIVLILFIFFSYSRTAYSLTGLVLFWSVIYVNKTSIRNFIFPLILLGFVFVFRSQLNIFNFTISESALDFFSRKSNNYSEDLINTRFYLINLKPLIDNYEVFNPFQMVIGDGESVQHSFISHSLIITGILGFLIFMKRFVFAFKYSINMIKMNNKVVSSKFLILILLVVLINDFVTNVSSFLPFAAYLSAMIMAFLFADIASLTNQKNNNID